MELVEIDDVAAAAQAIGDTVVGTPLVASPWSEHLWLKAENLQRTGAFKARGASYAVARVAHARPGRGVVTHSSGNHGQALAYAARAFGMPCTVVMPDQALPHKVRAVRAHGAEVVCVPAAQREAHAQHLAAARGLALVPPYDHRDVIAGQGTVGREIVTQLSEVDVVLVPVGGGGLAAGVATAVAALRPSAKVIGVEPALAADAHESLTVGVLRAWPVAQTYRTVADGLRAGLSELTLAHLRARLHDIITVTEEEILDTTGAMLHQARLVVEPSGAVAAAAYRHHRHALPAGRTVAVISGGNIDPALLRCLAA